MDTKEKTSVTVKTTVNAPIEKVWEAWTKPEHITKWNQASDDWYCPRATNDIRTGGRFSYTMSARDGSTSFDFGGVYTNVEKNKVIESKLEDGRTTHVQFNSDGNKTNIVETFEAETENSVELQRNGWQAILDNFKKHAESL